MALTVAVTGPTGEIGISASTRSKRSGGRAHPRNGAAPVRPRGPRLDEDRVPPRRHPRPRRGEALVARGRRRRPPRLPDPGFAGGEPADQPAGTRNVFQATVAAERPTPARLHLVGGGIRVPLRQPVAADRGRARPWIEGALLLRAEGRVRGACCRDHRRHRPRGLRSAAVHRRRTESDRVGRLDALEAGCPSCRRPLRGAVGAMQACCRHARPRRAAATGAPRRRRRRDRARRRRAGAPGAYNLAGDGEVSLSEVAAATGTRSIRVPQAAATAASAVLARLPMVPAGAEWVHVARNSVVMDTTRATTILGWSPRYHQPRDPGRPRRSVLTRPTGRAEFSRSRPTVDARCRE